MNNLIRIWPKQNNIIDQQFLRQRIQLQSTDQMVLQNYNTYSLNNFCSKIVVQLQTIQSSYDFYCLNLDNNKMSSHQTKNKSIPQTYQIPQTFLDAFMVFWIFLISENYLSSQEKKAIKNLYSNTLSVRGTSIDYSPLVTTYRDLQDKLKDMKVTNKPTKIVVDSINAEHLLERICSKGIQAKPDEIYIFAPSESEKYQALKLVQKYSNTNIFIVRKVSQIREIAEKNIKRWINKYQLFRNMFSLQKDNFQAAFERRVKLYACLNLDPLKYTSYLELFMQYVCQEINLGISSDFGSKMDYKQRKTIQNELKKGIQIKDQILKRKKEIERIQKIYNQAPSTELYENNKIIIKRLEKQISQKQDIFALNMVNLYKETFFYEIINRGLKKLQRKQFQWQKIALPFCFLHEAILYSYENNSNNLLKQINSAKQYILWRGGKISSDQKEQIMSKYKKDPFYEFSSFTSTSKSKETALSFLSQSQLNKVNCLFKYIIKKPKQINSAIHRRFLMHSYCQIANNNLQREDQVILNCLTIGKIISIQNQKISNKTHEKIPVITIQIGSFEDLFYVNSNEAQELLQDRNTFKELTKHFKDTIQLVMKFEQFQFAAAYQLCNQMQKSYNYLQRQIQQLTKQCQSIGENNKNEDLSHKRLSFFYSQQNYYSQLAEICRKMGNLTQASIYALNAINKYKQLENIDKNRSFCLHQEKLKEMYLKCSQILIEKHDFRRARQIILEKIADLEKEENLTQRQKNRVIISRMKLDLGVVNFKQGRLQEAKEKFIQSAQDVQKIFKSINYEDLKQETFFKDWIVALARDEAVKLFDGYQVYFQKRRKQQIEEATSIYGSEDRLLHLNRSAHFLENQTTQVISKHKEYFSSPQEYEEIINDIKHKVQQKMAVGNSQDKELNQTSQASLSSQNKRCQRKQQNSRMMNKYKKIKQKIDDQLVLKQKICHKDIQQQQKQIVSQKEKIEQMLSQFWQNPDVYFQSSYNFKQQFSENFINKQKENRQTLLKNSDEVTMQELTTYYKKSADSIEKYIKDLEYWGYSQSAPKVLQQYNNMIKLYIEIDCNSDAQKKIAAVKKMALVKKQEKYYELAVAYFLSGKIYQNSAERDFIYLEESDKQSKKIKNSFKHRLDKAQKALQQFDYSEQYFRKSLIYFQQNGSKIQNRQAYESQPQQVQLKIWKMKSLLVRVELQTNQNQIQKALYKEILDLKAIIREGLKKIKTSNADELQAQFKQTSALFNFYRGQYSKSKKQFDQCLELRSKKFGKCNWQNTLTMLKIVNYFQYSSVLKSKLLQYKGKIEDSYVRFKNYPFFWKISLANYYLSKDCQKNTTNCLRVINYLQNCLKHMEKIGFAQQSFYDQYCQIYDQQYHQFYNYVSPFLMNRPRIIKCERKKQVRVSKTTKKIEIQSFFGLGIIDGRDHQEIKMESIKLAQPPQLDRKITSLKAQQNGLNLQFVNSSFSKNHKINKFPKQEIYSPNKSSIKISQLSQKDIEQEYFLNEVCNSKTIFESTQPSTANNSQGKYSTYLMGLNSKNAIPSNNLKVRKTNSYNYQVSHNNRKIESKSINSNGKSYNGNHLSLNKSKQDILYGNKTSFEKSKEINCVKQSNLLATLLQNYNRISERQSTSCSRNKLPIKKQSFDQNFEQGQGLFAEGVSDSWNLAPYSVYKNKLSKNQKRN